MRPVMRGQLCLLPALAILLAGPVARVALAQDAGSPAPRPIARGAAVAIALAGAGRLALARTDSAAAFAAFLTAQARLNPALSLGYSRSTPRYHIDVELPLQRSDLRRARVGAAEAGRQAAWFRLAAERVDVVLDVDTSYTRALAARERLRLSRRTAVDADSLRAIAAARRDAGDVSDLDVQLAAVFAGQQTNVAAADSLTYLSALLDLQSAMGIVTDGVAFTPSDSLTMPPDPGDSDQPGEPASGAVARRGADAAATATPLSVAAAQSALESTRLTALAERRGRWLLPTLLAGFETGDPEGVEAGILPTVGIALPLPILDRNRGSIAQAEAARERARVELALARQASLTRTTRARRTLSIATDRVHRDRTLVALADTVAGKALTAYREGALPLPSVLEAQRAARDVLARYVDDLAEVWVATALLRALAASSATLSP